MVSLFALSLADQAEKYGAYAGIAAFFGLAVLSLLYFAQAREVKRLREWAGRVPERAREIEERAMAEAARRVQGTPRPAARPIPQTVGADAPGGGGHSRSHTAGGGGGPGREEWAGGPAKKTAPEGAEAPANGNGPPQPAAQHATPAGVQPT